MKVQIPDIPKLLDEAMAREIKTYPWRSNRASDLGHPCIRRAVYWRTTPEDAKGISLDLAYIFAEGREREAHVRAKLAKAKREADRQGIFLDFQEAGKGFYWPDYQIGGKLDGFFYVHSNGKPVPIPGEIKGVSANTWNRINTWQDMATSKLYYVRKWPGQVVVYMLMENAEQGLMVLENKGTGKLKLVEFSLDDPGVLEIGEKMLRNAEDINRHLADGALPDRVEFDSKVCWDCEFQHVCLPEEQLGTPSLRTEEELLARCKRREELESAYREYLDLDEGLKAEFRDAEGRVFIGTEYEVLTKHGTRHYKATEERDVEIKSVTIRRLGA